MKKIFLLISLFLGLYTQYFAQEITLKDQIRQLASDVESKYNGRDGIKLALLEFRLSTDQLTKFNQVIRDEFVIALQNSKKFSFIDPMVSAGIAREKEWSLAKVTNFGYYDNLGKAFMEKAGYVPNAYLYGQINDNDLTVTITAYLVMSGSTDAKVVSAISVDATEQTDQLLGKPVKFRPKKEKKPDTVFVERTVIIQTPPPQPQTVPQPPPQQQITPQSFTYPSATYSNFTFTVTDVRLSGNNMSISFMLVNNAQIDQAITITGNGTRFFDSGGNEYVNQTIVLGTSRSDYSVYKQLAPGVPVKGEIVFSQVPPTADIVLIEILLNDGKVTFRNLPVKK